MSAVKYCPLLQLFSMIKSEDGIKRRGDFFWSVGDFSFEKDTIRHIFTGQYYGLQYQASVTMITLYLDSLIYLHGLQYQASVTVITLYLDSLIYLYTQIGFLI